MTQLYRRESGNPKWNAQSNLSGRTHYADDETLRFFHARIVSSRAVDGGLLFALVESVALDMHNTKRGFRYAIFDLFGHAVARPELEDAYSTSKAAEKAMWDVLNTLNAVKITREGMKREKAALSRDHKYLTETIRDLKKSKKV